MADAHDPAALMSHALEAHDWRLAGLIARKLGEQGGIPRDGVRSAYGTLVVHLGLSGQPAE